MLAANDTDLSFLIGMAPDQLRMAIAHAGGLLAHASGRESAARTLRRVADRLLAPEAKPADWMAEKMRLTQAVRDRICAEISQETGIGLADIVGASRRQEVVRARMWAMWRLREIKNSLGLPRYSLPEIGRAFNRDHTTVIHALRVVRAALAAEQDEAVA